jgi:hypothetical protein
MQLEVFIFGTLYGFRTCAAQVRRLAQPKFPDLRSSSSRTCAAQVPEVAPRKFRNI